MRKNVATSHQDKVFKILSIRPVPHSRLPLCTFRISSRNVFEICESHPLPTFEFEMTLPNPQLKHTADIILLAAVKSIGWAKSFGYKKPEIGIVATGLSAFTYPMLPSDHFLLAINYISALYAIDDRVDVPNIKLHSIESDIESKLTMLNRFYTAFVSENFPEIAEGLKTGIALFKEFIANPASFSPEKCDEIKTYLRPVLDIQDTPLGSPECKESVSLLSLYIEIAQTVPDISPTLMRNLITSFSEYVLNIIPEKKHESRALNLEFYERRNVRKYVSGAMHVLEFAAVLMSIDLPFLESLFPSLIVMKHLCSIHVGESNDILSHYKEFLDKWNEMKDETESSIVPNTSLKLLRKILEQPSISIVDSMYTFHVSTKLGLQRYTEVGNAMSHGHFPCLLDEVKQDITSIHEKLFHMFDSYVLAINDFILLIEKKLSLLSQPTFDANKFQEAHEQELRTIKKYISDQTDVFVPPHLEFDAADTPFIVHRLQQHAKPSNIPSQVRSVIEVIQGWLTHPIAALLIPRYNINLAPDSTKTSEKLSPSEKIKRYVDSIIQLKNRIDSETGTTTVLPPPPLSTHITLSNLFENHQFDPSPLFRVMGEYIWCPQSPFTYFTSDFIQKTKAIKPYTPSLNGLRLTDHSRTQYILHPFITVPHENTKAKSPITLAMARNDILSFKAGIARVNWIEQYTLSPLPYDEKPSQAEFSVEEDIKSLGIEHHTSIFVDLLKSDFPSDYTDTLFQDLSSRMQSGTLKPRHMQSLQEEFKISLDYAVRHQRLDFICQFMLNLTPLCLCNTSDNELQSQRHSFIAYFIEALKTAFIQFNKPTADYLYCLGNILALPADACKTIHSSLPQISEEAFVPYETLHHVQFKDPQSIPEDEAFRIRLIQALSYSVLNANAALFLYIFTTTQQQIGTLNLQKDTFINTVNTHLDSLSIQAMDVKLWSFYQNLEENYGIPFQHKNPIYELDKVINGLNLKLAQTNEELDEIEKLTPLADLYPVETLFSPNISDPVTNLMHLSIQKDRNQLQAIKLFSTHHRAEAKKLSHSLCQNQGLQNYFQTRAKQSVLHEVALHGSLEALEYCMSLDADRTLQNSEGYTPFMLACLQGHVKKALLLFIPTRDFIVLKDNHGNTTMHYAFSLPDPTCVNHCLKLRSGYLNKKNKSKLTPLDLAVTNGHLETIRAALAFQNIEVVNAIHIGVEKNNIQALTLLFEYIYKSPSRLDHLQSIFMKTKEQKDLLSSALWCKPSTLHYVLDKLLDYYLQIYSLHGNQSYSIFSQNRINFWEPLALAVQSGLSIAIRTMFQWKDQKLKEIDHPSYSLYKSILQVEINPHNPPCPDVSSLTELAATYGHSDLVDFFHNDLDVKLNTNQAQSLTTKAIKGGHASVVDFLFQKYPETMSITSHPHWHSVLFRCAAENKLSMLKVFLQHGIQIDVPLKGLPFDYNFTPDFTCRFETTVLHIATYFKHEELVNFLCDYCTFDLTAKDSNGKTASQLWEGSFHEILSNFCEALYDDSSSDDES